jgi:hypothetical protein
MMLLQVLRSVSTVLDMPWNIKVRDDKVILYGKLVIKKMREKERKEKRRVVSGGTG